MSLSMEPIFVPEPVVSMSISPKSSKDRDSFSKAIARFTKEDPTLHITYDSDNKVCYHFPMEVHNFMHNFC
jgi:elongation factor G